MIARTKAPCIFLDRDGTLIQDKHYLCDPEGVELLPGVVEGLTLLQASGCALVVLSNQSGVGRGYFDAGRVDAVNARMVALLRAQGVSLTGTLYCPHSPDEHCPCRKPAPGLIHEAARRWGLEGLLRAGLFVSVGDKMSDVYLAQKLGGHGVLVLTGKGVEQVCACEGGGLVGSTVPEYVATDLVEAAHWILAGYH